jgi:hypothetical protein
MDLSTIFFTILYGGAIVFIILYLFRFQKPPIVIYPVATSIDYPETSWWPWSVSSYNTWPYWTGWWSGGGNGGYGGHMRRPIYRHGGHDRPWGGMNRTANRSADHSTGNRGGSGGGRGGRR